MKIIFYNTLHISILTRKNGQRLSIMIQVEIEKSATGT